MIRLVDEWNFPLSLICEVYISTVVAHMFGLYKIQAACWGTFWGPSTDSVHLLRLPKYPRHKLMTSYETRVTIGETGCVRWLLTLAHVSFVNMEGLIPCTAPSHQGATKTSWRHIQGALIWSTAGNRLRLYCESSSQSLNHHRTWSTGSDYWLLIYLLIYLSSFLWSCNSFTARPHREQKLLLVL